MPKTFGSGILLHRWLGEKWGERVYNLLGGLFIALIVYSVIYLPIANHGLGQDNHILGQVNRTETQKVFVVDNQILPFACAIAAAEYPQYKFNCPPLPKADTKPNG